MKMQIKEFAEQIGVSVRTLHYYDEIGLLKPSEVDAQNGYRFYDEKSLERMQEILFYRELDFSLKTIAQILSSPDYDKQQALTRQRKLLLAKKERLEQLINALDGLEKGEGFMKNNEYEKLKNEYAEEVRQRWGSTDAYKESQQRNTDFNKAAVLLDEVFEEFAEFNRSGISPDNEAAKIQVEKLQRCITENFYTCTNEILAGLGQMYVADERFKNNIDKHGEGMAEFVSQCIKSYCE
nr:MerR family transcriptional regulator [uncultured Ruminococcus sp.]